MPSVSEGNATPQTIFAAVGEALTRWERMEWALCQLNSIMSGNAGDVETEAQYGMDYSIFERRVQAVEETARAFFMRHCNQDNEATLRKIVDRARKLSICRHQIAHGLVDQVTHATFSEDGDFADWHDGKTTYYLNAPWYSEPRLRQKWPGYTSADIRVIFQNFTTLENRIRSLCQRILPPA